VAVQPRAEKVNMKIMNSSRLKKKRRVLVSGTKKIPRLAVFKSAKIIYASLIDDVKGMTLATADSREIKSDKHDKDTAGKVGELIAKKGKAEKVTTVVFDRSGYKYHGKIKSLADGARKGGLKF
jgi:large subunit ribosomal protein L18